MCGWNGDQEGERSLTTRSEGKYTGLPISWRNISPETDEVVFGEGNSASMCPGVKGCVFGVADLELARRDTCDFHLSMVQYMQYQAHIYVQCILSRAIWASAVADYKNSARQDV